MGSRQPVHYAARTDVGRIREHNEDCYCVNAELGLFVLADGMGGHASGEVASEIAVNMIEQQIRPWAVERGGELRLRGFADGVVQPRRPRL